MNKMTLRLFRPRCAYFQRILQIKSKSLIISGKGNQTNFK